MNCKILNISSNDLYKHITSSHTKNNCISLFTPTYNRAPLLGRVYTCLKKQTSKNFLWIIVNDGSSDDSDSCCLKFIKENIIPILYIKKENGGKHSAFKVALEECQTEFFQCMDDDDIYSADAVNKYLEIWSQIDKEGKSATIGAIRTLARRRNGTFVASKQVKEAATEDCTTLEMNHIRHNYQENWTCYRTEALRQVDLFPEGYWLSEQHTFFSEAIWQGRFARKFKCRYVYISLREYTNDAEVSIIRSVKNSRHYTNMFINSKMILEEQYDYISRSTKELLRSVCLVLLLRKQIGVSQKMLLAHTENAYVRRLYRLLSPITLFHKLIMATR